MSEEIVEESGEDQKQLKFDPKEIEEQLVKMAQERSEDPTETAAQAYRMYLPYFEKNLSKISTRGLRRVINFLVKYPLEVESIKSANEFEREFMHLTNTLIEAKLIMIMDTYRLNAEQLYDAMHTPLTQEEADQVIADLKAGGASDEDIAAIHNKSE
jgi:hypothetical protein